jgi:hypothetical protein
MGAIVCQVESWESVEFEVRSPGDFSRGVNLQSERRCPACNSLVYSRRHKLCGLCGEALPPACIFSDAEAHSIEMRLNEERQRHRQWLHRFGD